jgi:hypothetical protein
MTHVNILHNLVQVNNDQKKFSRKTKLKVNHCKAGDIFH